MKYPPREMKVEHLNWLMLVFNTDLHANAKLIAAYLNTYMNASNHSAWPSIGRIVDETSLSRASVQRYTNMLVEEGWLSKKLGGVFDGKNTPNTYTLQWPERIANLHKSEQTDSRNPAQHYSDGGYLTEAGGPPTEAGGASHRGGGGIPQRPKSVIESEIESEKRNTYSSDDERENEYASFDAFWDKWPKKVDKDQARKRWNKLKPDQDLFNKIMANIEAHALAGDWDDRQYVPGPAKYLLNKKWKDQVYARTPSATKKSPTAGNQALAEKMLGELSTGASHI